MRIELVLVIAMVATTWLADANPVICLVVNRRSDPFHAVSIAHTFSNMTTRLLRSDFLELDLLSISDSIRRMNCTLVVGPGSDEQYLSRGATGLTSFAAAVAWSTATRVSLYDYGTISREMGNPIEHPFYRRLRVTNYTLELLAIFQYFGWTRTAILKTRDAIDVSLQQTSIMVEVDTQIELPVSAAVLERFFRSVPSRVLVIVIAIPESVFAHENVVAMARKLQLHLEKVFIFLAQDTKCRVHLPGSLCVTRAVNLSLWDALQRNDSEANRQLWIADLPQQVNHPSSPSLRDALSVDALLAAVRPASVGVSGPLLLSPNGERLSSLVSVYNMLPNSSLRLLVLRGQETVDSMGFAGTFWRGAFQEPPRENGPLAASSEDFIWISVVLVAVSLASVGMAWCGLRKLDRSRRQKYCFSAKDTDTGGFMFIVVPFFNELRSIAPEAIDRILAVWRTQVELLAARHKVCLVKVCEDRMAFVASSDVNRLVDVAAELQVALFSADWSFAPDLEPFYRELDGIESDVDAVLYNDRWNGLRVSIGISAGGFHVLEMDTSVDYVGDAVNVASRIATHACQPGQTLLAEEASLTDKASEGFAIIPYGAQKLPGQIALTTLLEVRPRGLEERQFSQGSTGFGDTNSDLFLRDFNASLYAASTDFSSVSSSALTDTTIVGVE